MAKQHVTLLVDFPNWAFDYIARSIARRLRHRFKFSIKYTSKKDRLNPKTTDLLHVFFWGEDYYKQFGFQKNQIVKEVASLRWMHEDRYGPISTEEFVRQYLDDCIAVTTPCRSIYELLLPHVSSLFHTPNGVESSAYRGEVVRPLSKKYLTIGWVGNPNDTTKGLKDIIEPAAHGFELHSTLGNLSRRQMRKFYRNIDILAIGSIAESQPLPLLESFASGCFPVSTNVGIVPEFVKDRINGLVVERNIESFAKAFQWCNQNRDVLAQASAINKKLARERSWSNCVSRIDEVYSFLLQGNAHVTARSGLAEFVDFSSDNALGERRYVPTFSAVMSFIERQRLFAEDDIVRLLRGSRNNKGLLDVINTIRRKVF